MYPTRPARVHLPPPDERRGGGRAARRARGRAAARRRPQPAAGDEAAARRLPRRSSTSAASRASPGSSRTATAVRIGALTTHAEVAASELVQRAVPGARRGGRADRRPPGAEPRHDRRQPRPRRPRRRLPDGGDGARRDDHRGRAGDGSREIAAGDFFTGIFATALEPGELVTSVHVPAAAAGTGAPTCKHKHPASGYAVVGVAAASRSRAATCTRAQIVVGGVTGPRSRRAAAAEKLVGAAPVGGRDRRGRGRRPRGARRARSATATRPASTARTWPGCSRGGRSRPRSSARDVARAGGAVSRPLRRLRQGRGGPALGLAADEISAPHRHVSAAEDPFLPKRCRCRGSRRI